MGEIPNWLARAGETDVCTAGGCSLADERTEPLMDERL